MSLLHSTALYVITSGVVAGFCFGAFATWMTP